MILHFSESHDSSRIYHQILLKSANHAVFQAKMIALCYADCKRFATFAIHF